MEIPAAIAANSVPAPPPLRPPQPAHTRSMSRRTPGRSIVVAFFLVLVPVLVLFVLVLVPGLVVFGLLLFVLFLFLFVLSAAGPTLGLFDLVEVKFVPGL